MSNQGEQEKQQPEHLSIEEVRQFILAELEASQQIIATLSDEELADVAGGGQGISVSYSGDGDIRSIFTPLYSRSAPSTPRANASSQPLRRTKSLNDLPNTDVHSINNYLGLRIFGRHN
jgi:1,6-anhydro-N-acetylmuramate kinase